MSPSHFRPCCRRRGLAAFRFAFLVGCAPAALAQTGPADGPWSGSVQCVLDGQLATYTRQETQTWTLTDSSPTPVGGFRIYNATWTVTGQGRVNATTWTVNVPATPVELAMFVRASDQKLIVRQWSSLKQIPGAITGTRSMTPFFRPASEWSFPWIDEDKSRTTLDGSKPANADALPADFFFSGAPVNATCTWQFTKSGGSSKSGSTPPPAGHQEGKYPPRDNPPSIPSDPGKNPPRPPPEPEAGKYPPRPPPEPETGKYPPDANPPAPDSGKKYAPRLASLTPNSGAVGTVTIVQLHGVDTRWQAGVTSADFGPGIDVATTLQIDSRNRATVSARIDAGATPGPRTITLTTGPEVVTLANGFTVTRPADPPPDSGGNGPREPAAQLMTIDPAVVEQGANDALVTLTGRGTHWQGGVTTADFGLDIRVAALTVNSPTEAIARLIVSSSAPIGPRVVWVRTTTNTNRPENVGLTDKFVVKARETKSPVLPPPPPIGTAPTSGHYRIILNGIRVNHRTFEGVENDGPGDEIFASVRVQVAKRDLTTWSTSVVKTAVHGNVQNRPDRVRGGSADALGGFVSGDTFPTGQDPARITATPLPQTFPFLIWEGTLSRASDVVLIEPSLWESDGDDCVCNDWAGNTDLAFGLSRGGAIGAQIKQTLLNRIAQSDLSPISDIGWPIMCHNSYSIGIGGGCSCQPGKDRPIGLVNGNEQAGTFNGPGIVFTHEAIEKALGASPQPGGLPRGVMMLRFADTGFHFEGDYDLYLRVERVTGAPSPPPPGNPPTVDVAPIRPPERRIAPEPPIADVTPVRPPERRVAPEPPLTGATLLRLTPPTAQQGQHGVVIALDTAPSQYFSPGGTADFGPGIALRSFEFLTPTSARAVIDVAADAAIGPRTLTLRRALRPPDTFADVFSVTAAP